MKIHGSHPFAVPTEQVWLALTDPLRLAQALPGCEKLEKTGDHAYEGIVTIKVGPGRGVFQIQLSLHELQAPHQFEVMFAAAGDVGQLMGHATVQLQPDGDDTTLTYQAEAEAEGTIAAIGTRLLETSARALMRQTFQQIEQQLTPAPSLPEPTPVASATPVALSLAQEMWHNFNQQEEKRALLYGLIGALGGLVLFRWASQWLTRRWARKIARYVAEELKQSQSLR